MMEYFKFSLVLFGNDSVGTNGKEMWSWNMEEL